jgi:hypothetical protein
VNAGNDCRMEIRTDVLGQIDGEALGVAEDNVEGPLPDGDFDGDAAWTGWRWRFDGDVPVPLVLKYLDWSRRVLARCNNIPADPYFSAAFLISQHQHHAN